MWCLITGLIAAACGKLETAMQTSSPDGKVAVTKPIMNGTSNGTFGTKSYPNGNRIKTANGPPLKSSMYMNGNGVHA